MGKRWNLEAMNNFCKSTNGYEEYEILETKRVEKSYQNQLWSLVKCPNDNHESYWVCWNNFTKGYMCKQCYQEENGITAWTKESVYEFYNQYDINIIDINTWKDVDKSIWCYDKYGFKVQASITNLKAGHIPSFIQRNKFALENIKLYCKLFRPEYDIISKKYDNIKTEYQWVYKGELPDDMSNIFNTTADGFIHGGCGHPHLSKSKSNGNKIFERELIVHDINYETEKTFKGCKDKSLLRFDFYLPDSNEGF